MFAAVGDRLVVRSQRVDGPERDGEILAVGHDDGSPPYLVRWSDTGHESLFFPAANAYVEHFDAQHTD
jgi:hypothetical protein